MKKSKIVIGVLSILIGFFVLVESYDVFRLANVFGVNGFHIYVGFLVGLIFIALGVLSIVLLVEQWKKYVQITIPLSLIAISLCFEGPNIFKDLLLFAVWGVVCLIYALVIYAKYRKNNVTEKETISQIANQTTCPYCHAVIDGSSMFCGSCGKKIQKECPHCGSLIMANSVFCGNCGKKVEEVPSSIPVELTQNTCPHCGALVNGDDMFCQNCGKKINEDSLTDSNPSQSRPSSDNGNLNIRWDGAFALVDAKIKMSVNHSKIGEFSFKQGFETAIPITSSNMKVATKVGLVSTTESLELNPNENYTYELAYHRMSGWFGFILYDNEGNEIRRDKLHWGMWILSFLIPIAGLIYAIVGWKKRPAASYTAIYAALIGFIVSFTVSYRIANMRSDFMSIFDNYKNSNNTTLVQDKDSIEALDINETEDTSDADIQLIKDWYKYVLGGSPTENDMKKYLSPDVMQKIWEADYEETYSYWLFRTSAQDYDPIVGDVSKVNDVKADGDGWYTVNYLDMGSKGETKVKVVNGKISELKLDKSWDSISDPKSVKQLEEDVATMDSYEKEEYVDDDISRCWFVYGTKRELESENVIANDKIADNFNKKYFSEVGRDEKKVFNLYSSTAQVLSNHPSDSYELRKDEKGNCNLRIIDPSNFWTYTNYLVIVVE